jgi:hypothetical protein
MGAALFKADGSTAEYGTFTDETWNGTGFTLTGSASAYTNDTIKVVNGVLQP